MTSAPICAVCGAHVRVGALFCGTCGNPFSVNSASHHTRTAPESAGDPDQHSAIFGSSHRFVQLRVFLTLFIALGVIALVIGSRGRTTASVATAHRHSTTAVPSTPVLTTLQSSITMRSDARLALRAPPTSSPLMASDLLSVHFIDVGQGDSIFVQAPNGMTALIDGGYDNGMSLAYLQAQGVQRIDVMITSHPHADHIGGLVEVLRALPVGSIWTSGAAHTTGMYEQFLDAIGDAQVPYYEAKPGDRIPFGDLMFDVIRSDPSASDLNDTSLVLRLAYADVSFLFTDHAEAPSEQALVREVPMQLQAPVLKVGHHGSSTSSSSVFLAAVAPKIAVYSAGTDNSYGHPHAATLAALQAVGATIYGTAVDGTVVITTDGQSYSLTTSTGRTEPKAAMDTSMAPVSTPFPATAKATVPASISMSDGGDRNCGDFATHMDAQTFFEAAGGPHRDAHHLDGDGDGSACESLP